MSSEAEEEPEPKGGDDETTGTINGGDDKEVAVTSDGENDEDFYRGYAVDKTEHPGIMSIARLID